MSRDRWRILLALVIVALAWGLFLAGAQATSIGITVTRGTTVALPEHGLVPVRVYTNEGRTAAGILHPDGSVAWFTYPDGGPEVGDRLITAWTRTALAGGDVLLTATTGVKVANTRAQWAGEVP